MNTIAELIKKEGLTPCRLQTETKQETKHPARILEQFAAGKDQVGGWLTMKSHVLLVREGCLYQSGKVGAPYVQIPFTDLGHFGPLVNGELGSPGASLQGHWNGAGWTMVTLSDEPGEECWYQCVTHLGDWRDDQPVTQANLHYRRYWRRDGGMRPFAARLISFGGVS